jgi:3-hydroxyisobutyrate dehydrogenase-like beta-hydroxyacid dehydrogenase
MVEGTIAVIGLGIMGSRMANRLRLNGHALRGYDPSPASLEAFATAGGEAAESPAAAVQGCWAALLSLPDSDVSRRVCLGEEGISGSGVAGLLVLDTTTGRPEDAISNAAGLAPAGIDYGDTTVSGNAPFAASGQLVVMFGGSPEAYEKGRPVFEAIGRSHHHVGPVGAGARVKLIVNQILSIQRMALAEGLVTAELAGLDLERILEVLKDSLAYSKAMDVYGDNIVAGTHDPPAARLRQTHKDARLMIEHAATLKAPAHLIEVVRAALAEGEASGLGDLDNSAIAEVVRRRAGIGRVKKA